MTLLDLSSLSVALRSRPVLSQVDLEVSAGELVGLIGPNGAGKTSLMRAALGLIPFQGRSNLADMTPDRRARVAAWMPQSREIAWPVTVERLVALGRLPQHGGPLGRLNAADREAIEGALERMELLHLRKRTATRLSGGEQARVLIARALAQETPLLMADEPIAGLDPEHQLATMQIFRELADEGKAVVVSMHDLGLAARFCSRLLLIDHGRLVADGVPEAVMTPENLRSVFHIDCHIARTASGLVLQPTGIAGR
ncbi:ABC transporter ATP-binding protein [Qingshengfaniella alkalisoli]|uniref:ABC transporter ATP-binding protein n=1 Tax=Qingshengfaniella alkalisoli TaxID=2599296 RepID=A0A5B8JBT3_9RHOB|nr:ABC transporter ATP-binding protein [Qingshengfaniella alkalisoli]QDY71687.1 ABC transporter ATP-binding protein [Qingshengfaniella alkalisoli]